MGSFIYIPTGIPTISGSITISGPKIALQNLTATFTGSVTGSPTPTASYQWYRGNTPITSGVGYNTATYTLQIADIGENVWVRLTYTNTSGNAYVDSQLIYIPITIADKYPTGIAYGWSFYLLKASYYNSPCIRIRNSLNNETDIGFDENGYIDTNAIVAHSTAGGATGTAYVKGWYDQIGGDYLEQLTYSPNNLQFQICTGGACITENGIVTMIATATNTIVPRMTSTSSNTSGVWNFLHDGTVPNYAVHCIASTPTSSSATISYYATTTANTLCGARMSYVAGVIAVQLVNPSNAVFVNQSVNAPLNQQLKFLQLITPQGSPATQRGKTLFGNYFLASNTSSATTSTGNPTNTLFIGANTGAVFTFKYQCLIIYKSHDDAFNVSNVLTTQYKTNP